MENVFTEIFHYVSDHYRLFEGFGYADLDIYLCRKGVAKSFFKGRVTKNFKHIIVDEFQDTSRIQYDIMKKLWMGISTASTVSVMKNRPFMDLEAGIQKFFKK